MLRRNYLLIIAILTLAVACSNTATETQHEETLAASEPVPPKGKKTEISGVFKGSSNQPVYLEILKANAVEKVDTAITDESGAFNLELNLEVPGFYRVGVHPNNVCVLIVYPGDKIKVTAEATNIFKTYSIQGSEESSRLRALNMVLMERDSIAMIAEQARTNQNQQLFNEAVQAYNQTLVKVIADVKKFVDEKPGSLASLAAIQNLDINEDYPYYKKVIAALDGKVDGNEFYEVMKRQVQQEGKLAVGSEAPEIALPQPDGGELKLSDLRGQYVLIDFWASWCGPCRRENPNVRKVYQKYSDKGFEIYGVSLDKNKAAWVNAIEQDGLPWKHVSDLKYWQSSVVPQYGIKGIPLTFLIDPEGNIVAKNLRGPSLEAKLAEIFDN